jgi:hypothetical protein
MAAFLQGAFNTTSSNPTDNAVHANTNRRRLLRKLRTGVQRLTHPQRPSGEGPDSHGPPRTNDRLQIHRSPSRSGVHSGAAGQSPRGDGPALHARPSQANPHVHGWFGRS